MKLETAIKNYRSRLIRKAKRSGIWENFGQEEVMLLRNEYSANQYLNDGVWDQINTFDLWCQNYTGL